VAIANGGTGATSAGSALSNLGAANIAGDSFTGNVRIGSAATTSLSVGLASPTTSTIYQFFVGTSTFSGQSGAGAEADFGINWYYNSGFKYRTSDYAARVTFNSTSNGNISFETAGSGTADAAITFTPKLAISNAGVVTMGHYGAGTATFDASGNISSVSDERVKRDIRPFTRGLEAVMGLKPILHGYTLASGLDQTKDDYAGFSAQNVQLFIPEAVGRNGDGTLSLSDRPIMGAMVNSIQALNDRIKSLEAKVADLEKRKN
jgi:hypothetical protein